jgi:acyl transferase domain-containing protein/acyl carrier protein
MSDSSMNDEATGLEIAVVGMAGQFPGASDTREFWENLKNGVESITFFTDEELLAAGVRPEALSDPNYVRAGAVLDGVELFDAAFFGFNPREAETLDPQQRLFLQCAWTALEDAGYAAKTGDGSRIGVFAGASMNTYVFNLRGNQRFIDAVGLFPLLIGNDKDYLSTRVSYQLNLTGPSVVVQAACSTSLVAVHYACQSLLGGECDMALTGGVAVRVPHKSGYVYQEGGILSPDGHCRAFDARAQGTIGGNGVGVVVLKRLEDAVSAGDTIRAIIKGSAVNNDGSLKIGFTAPRIDGQAEVIRAAQAVAGVEPATVTYIEAHGTGTSLGDPIEIAALMQAFDIDEGSEPFCAIGSVKTNFGHLDAAAGIASLIKTVLALEHKVLPPSLNFESAAPQLSLEKSPFYINNRLSPWQVEGAHAPRRAGVSSYGIGGTNAHVVLEEAPPPAPSSVPARPCQLLVLSAKTPGALDAARFNLAAHLGANPGIDLADAAYTYQAGRKAFRHRYALVCRNVAEATDKLGARDPLHLLKGEADESFERGVVFMFPGQGAQYAGMGAELYRTEPAFRATVDECAEILRPVLDLDVRALMFASNNRRAEADLLLEQTKFTQPALFTIEYALAALWNEWGVRPGAMIGHSLGEYVAACLAGVFSLEDALTLVAARARLMQELPPSAMLAVGLPEAEVQTLLGDELSLASVNGPSLCVVAGVTSAVEELEGRLAGRDLFSRRLHTSHAFHSAMMEPISQTFAALIEEKKPRPPQIPYISNVTGTWIRDDEATSPRHWAEHLRRTVRFGDGIRELLKDKSSVLLEVGPGQTLSTLARHQCDKTGIERVVASMPRPTRDVSESEYLLTAAAGLWLNDAGIDWQGFHRHDRRRRLPLPTYPFERQRFWVDADETVSVASTAERESLDKLADMSDWFSAVSWKRLPSKVDGETGGGRDVVVDEPASASRWLVFVDGCGLGDALVERLRQEGRQVVAVSPGERFERLDDHAYRIDPRQVEHYDELWDALRGLEIFPRRIVHMWSVTAEDVTVAAQPRWRERLESALDGGFRSLLHLARTLAGQPFEGEMHISVISNGVQKVLGGERLRPEKATLLGACKIIPLEYANLSCRSIDVSLGEGQSPLIDMLSAEVKAGAGDESSEAVIALRGEYRWAQAFEPLRLPEVSTAEVPLLRQEGVYLITGGLGGLGLELAQHLARRVRARLVLTGRTKLPARPEWESWLAAGHDERDGVSLKLKKLLEIESAGAKVLALNADVTSEHEMREALARARETFGEINGVIHAAGIAGGGLIELRSDETMSDVLAPKVHGTLVLESLLEGSTPDFIALCSSVTAIVGVVGQSDYCAANAFLDAMAQAHSGGGGARRATRVVSINWDAWQQVGMAERAFVPDAFRELHLENLSKGILPEEGVAAFDRVLSASQPQVVVSTRRLSAMHRKAQANTLAKAGLESLTERPASRVTLHPRPQLSTPYVAPQDETELSVARIWQELLGVEEVGINDNFFELGGHSLLATQIISQVRSALKVSLSLRHLFESPTIAALAAAIRGTEGAASASKQEKSAIRPVPRDRELPLSFAQQRLWFLHRLEPDSPFYNVSVAFRLEGQLNIPALERCFNEITRRHEVLRTTFTEVNGQAVQMVKPEMEFRVDFDDLSGMESAAAGPEMERRVREEARRPFSLDTGPLLRVRVMRVAEEEHRVVLIMHHIVSDGWSMGVIAKEVAALYEAYARGEESPLEELPIQYADFAHWQRHWLRDEVLEAQLDYWRKQLAGAPTMLELPGDRPRPPVQTFHGARYHFSFGVSLNERLKEFSRAEGVTLFMSLLAGLSIVLGRYSGQTDILVGTTIANRNRAETEDLIGFFVNMLVMRTDLSGDPSVRGLLRQVREHALEAYAHQDLPFEKLVEELRLDRGLSRAPLTQVVFSLQNAPLDELRLEDLRMTLVEVESETAKFDVVVNLWEARGEMHGWMEYNRDVFDETRIQRMVQHYENVLREMLEQRDGMVDEIDMLSAEEGAMLEQQVEIEELDTSFSF